MSYRSLQNRMDGAAAALLWLMAIAVIVGPFIAHVVVTVKTNWSAMLIIGLVVPPVGWVHGVGIILGIW